jgi:hypothetical protein
MGFSLILRKYVLKSKQLNACVPPASRLRGMEPQAVVFKAVGIQAGRLTFSAIGALGWTGGLYTLSIQRNPLR